TYNNFDIHTNNINQLLYQGNVGTSVEASIDHRLFSEEGRNSIKEDIQKALSNNAAYKELTKDGMEAFESIFNEQTAIVERADKINTYAEIGEIVFEIGVGIGTAKVGTQLVKEAIEETIESGIKRGVDDVVVHFGQVENQVYHTFRHIDEMGLDRNVVQKAIKTDLAKVSNQIQTETMLSRTIEINGQKLQYNLYKFKNGEINIGRINAIKD
ncbi:MAG: hypothetical protein LBL65_07595, partial [Campylobacteraceae bacterium]|nr:hypothetical protein [Campylobacteraceae bacterium]